MIHIVKGFGIVNKAEIDVLLELSCFFHDPADVGNLISGSSAFSKTSLNIRKFMVHVLPGESQGRGSLVGYRLWDRTELVLEAEVTLQAEETPRVSRPLSRH